MASDLRVGDVAEAEGTSPDGRFRNWPAGLVGPLLIVVAVAVVLHGFLFGSRVSSQHPDVLGFWLPTYCFLGKTLAGGHIAAWNPHVMAGVPFAADPQSGWMYAPAMLLFSALPCGVAIRLLIALQPILGGLGLYGFLRSERVSRPAATAGGLALALGLAGSRLALFLPFPSSFAWTAVLLWACSAVSHSRSWPRRLGWVLVAALVWGQLAASYFSHGLIIGTAAAATYVVVKLWREARAGERSSAQGLAVAGLLVLAALAVNLAFLLPRLAYVPETSYGRIVAGPAQPAAPSALWPLKLAVAPGGYLGIAVLVLALAAPWSRRHRSLALTFGSFGVASYLLGMDGIAPALARAVEGIPVLDFYSHFPGRFSLGLFLALPVLAAVGLDSWMEDRSPAQRALMALPGAVVFLIIPMALGAFGFRLLIPVLGAIAAAVALWMVAKRPHAALVVPALIAVELVTAALIGQTSGRLGAGRAYADDLFRTTSSGWFVPLARPNIEVDAYLRPGPIARALKRSDTRYLSLDPAEASERGYLDLQDPGHWGLMANQRAMLIGLQDAQGYNPVQLERYWTYVRAVAGRPLAYNTSIFDAPTAATMDLLQVGQVIVRDRHGTVPCCLRARDGRWLLFGSSSSPIRATTLSSWRVVGDEDASLRAVTEEGFDPSRTVILETDPAPWFGGAPGRGAGAGTGGPVRSPRPQTESIPLIVATEPSVVLVRIPYARNWHATVDGEPTRILPADHFLMGIPVRRGAHSIFLTYDDPWIGYGLLGSALSLLAIALAALAWGLRSRWTAHGQRNQPYHAAASQGLEPKGSR